MPCACNDKSAPNGWRVISPDGGTRVYNTEVEAAAAARRSGGSYSRA